MTVTLQISHHGMCMPFLLVLQSFKWHEGTDDFDFEISFASEVVEAVSNQQSFRTNIALGLILT